jgi:predicted amidophosphoribosyltransferase
MSMHEVICPTCGAINHADGDTCWRCLAEVHPVVRRVGEKTPDAATA